MAKQLNVNLAFTADTGKAKAQLQDLQRQLTNIVNQSSKGSGLGINKDIEEAVKSAAELQVHLSKAVNTQTGNLDFSKLSESLHKSGKSLEDYGKQLRDLGPAGQKAFQALATSVANAEIPIRRSNAALTEMWTTLKNTARWQLSSSMLHNFMGAVSTAYGYAQDLNKSLNDIRIVTGQNTDQMADFAEQANKAAKALSTTTTSYTNASLIYYQQGLSDEEVKARTDLTIKMANASGQSAEVVSDQLTAIWNNFSKGADDLEHFADVLTKLGAETASSSEEISIGLEKFAAIGDTIGLSYDNAAAALATVTATTRQSAEVVGTAFKTIFARIQGLNLGETLDDGTSLNKYSEALSKVGISIFDTVGNIKDMNTILDEMGAKWKTISKDQQIALAQTVAGVRQYNQLVALMDNFDFYEQNLSSAQNSAGSLQAQADIYAESWEAAQKRVKAASQAIYQDLLNDEAFIDILDSIEKILTGVDKLIDSVGGLSGVLTSIGAIATKVFHKQMAQSLTDAAYSMKMMTSAGRESIKKEKTDFLNNAAGIRRDSDYEDKDEKVRTEILKNELEIQAKLIEGAERMSETELEINKKLIDRAKIQSELRLKAAEDLVKKKEEVGEKSFNARVKITQKAMDEDLDDEKQKKQTEKFLELQKKLRTGINVKTNLSKELEDISKSGKNVNKHLQFIEKQARKLKDSKLDSWIEELKESDIEAEDLGSTIVKIIARINQLEEESKGEIIELGLDKKEVDDLVDSMQKRANAQKVVTEETKKDKKVQETVRKSIEESHGAQKNWADDLVNVANATMSAVSAIQILGNTWETIQDPDVSDWEKFTATISGLATAFPMLSMALNKNTIESLSATSAAIGHAFGLKVEKVALDEASMAAEGFGLSLAKSLLPLAGLLITIGVLAIGIKHLSDEYNKDADAAEEATKQTQKYQEQLNDAKNAVEEFKSSLNDFDQAVKNIDDLTKGTKAYEEAIKAANEKAKELIDNYGLLKGQDWHYNDKGLIEFDKDKETGQTALDRKQSILKQAEVNAENALYSAKIYSNEANLRSQMTNVRRNIGSIIDTTISDDNYSGENEKRALSAYEMDKLVSAFDLVRDSAEAGSEALETALLGVEDLPQTVKDNISSITSDPKIVSSLFGLIDDKNQIKENNDTYSKEIAQNVLEGKLNDRISSMTLNKDGSVNEGLYNLISGAITEASVSAVESLTSQYEKVNVSGIKSNAQLKNFISTENLEDYILNLTGQSSQSALSDDEELALTYAQMMLKKQGRDDSRSSLTYQDGNGVGTVRDAQGNEIISEVSDEVMRREIAQQAKMDSITSKFSADSEEAGQRALEAVEALVGGANSLGEKFGVDFTGALLSSIANGSYEYTDLSSLYGFLDPSQIEELKGMSYSELLEALGISSDDIKALGYDRGTDFAVAIRKGLEDYNPMDYWEEQIRSGREGQADADSIIQATQEGKELTEEQIKSLNRLKEKHEELKDTRNLSEHEYLELLRNIQEEEEKRERQGLLESKKKLEDNLLELKVGIDDEEIYKTLQQIQEKEYQIKLNVEADLASDVDQAFGLANEIDALRAYVEDGLEITYDKAQEIIAAGYGAMLQNAEATSKSTIKMNEETVKAYIDGKQAEFEEDKNTKIKQLQNEITLLNTQKDILIKKGEALSKARQANIDGGKDEALAEAMLLDEQYQDELEAMQATLDSDDDKNDALSENAEKLYNTLSGMYETDSLNEQNAAQASDEASKQHQKNVIEYYNQMQRAVVMYSNAVRDSATGNALMKPVNPIGGAAVNGNDAGQNEAASGYEKGAPILEDKLKDLTKNLKEDELNTVIDKLIEDNQKAIDSVEDQIGAAEAGIRALQSVGGSEDGIIGSKSKGGESKKDKDLFDIDPNSLKKLEEESERYHEVKEVLQSVGYELDDISKKKDRAFGANKLKAIEAETKALKKQQKAQKEYVKEIEGYLKQDTEALTKYGANLDADGNINNYDEIIAQQVSAYNEAYLNYITAKNEAVAAYNTSTKDDAADKVYNDSIKAAESQWKTAETAYTNFKDQVKQYEESLDLLEEQQQALIDIQNQIQDNNYEKLTYKLELEMIVNDNEMKELDYYFGKMEGDIEKAVEAFGILQDKLDVTSEKLFDYEDHFNSLEQAYAAGQISQADYIAGLQECYDALYDNIEALNDLDKQMMEYYGETYDLALEKIETYTSQMEHLNSVLDHYKSIMSLLGKESDFETMGVIIEGQVKVAEDSYKSSKSIYELAKEQKEAAYEELMSAENDAERELLQKNYDKALEEFNNAQETMLTDAETYGELIKEALVNSMSQAAKEMEKALTGVWGSFENLQEQMGLHSTNWDEYLTNTNKLYETNKLLNQVAQDMEKTDNRASKAKYQAFSKEIEQLQEKDKLSKLELEIAQAKYNMLQAQIALEDAQNAKSMVRLSRDSEGNYGYVYTADKEKVNQAEQDLADAENDLYNIRLDAANEYAEKTIQAKQDLSNRLTEIDKAYQEGAYASEEEYQAARSAVIEKYTDLITTYSNLYGIATGEDARVVEDAWSTTYSNVVQDGGVWKDAITTYTENVTTAFETWQSRIGELTDLVGKDLDETKEKVDSITNASKLLKDELTKDVIPSVSKTLTEVRKLTGEYAIQRESVLDLAESYEDLAKSIKEAIREKAKLEKNEQGDLEDTDVSGDSTKDPNAQLQETRPADAGPGSSSSGSSSGDGDGILNVGDEVTFTGGVYYNDSEGGGPTGSRGPGKKVRVDRIKPGSNYPIHVISGDSAFGWLREDQLSGFNTGGYTGEWGAEGKLALLHEKEIVLNAVDTENLLASVQILRELTKAIDLNATWASMGIGSLNAVGVGDTSTTLEQKVEIHAEFPNATDHNEIEEAFNTLINRASQYANRF